MFALAALTAAPDLTLRSAAPSDRVEVTQCRFQSGPRLLLVRIGADYEMLFVDGDMVDGADIRERPDGSHELETNGGVWSYAAIDALFEELRPRGFTSIAASELPERLNDHDVPVCQHPYKDGTR
jgi:hypothetical protein